MTRVVLDASVGVKWFRTEPGTPQAVELLRQHGSGDISITVPSLFVYEFMGVAVRLLDGDEYTELWTRFLGWRINVHEVSDSLVRDAMRISADLGCTFYDAVAPALAEAIDATLYSADHRAHAEWPGVMLIG